MKLLDLPLKDLETLFNTLDEDNSGEVKTETFFRNCSRLRGPALACDMHRMSVDFGRYIQWGETLCDLSKETSDRLEQLVAHMEVVDREIIKGDKDGDDPVLKHRRMKSNRKSSGSPKRQPRPIPERFAEEQNVPVNENNNEVDVLRSQSKRSVLSRRSSLSDLRSVMGANLRNELRPLGEQFNVIGQTDARFADPRGQKAVRIASKEAMIT